MGLFGSGRELEVAPEFEEYTHPTEPVECESFATQALCAAESSCTWVESPGVCKNNHYHGRFPYSCVCTGSDGLEFPEFNDEEFDPDSYNSELAGLCACGALARTARMIVGDAVVDSTETPDYENPTFSNLPASDFYTPFCSPLEPCAGIPQGTSCALYTNVNDCQDSSIILSDSTYANCLWALDICVPSQFAPPNGEFIVDESPELDEIKRCTTKATNPQRFCEASATGEFQ